MKRLNFHTSSIPLAFLVLGLISFGLLVPWLGFYWDDWPFAWFAHVLGPIGFKDTFANDRPFLSLVYMLTTPIFGSNPLAWQLFGIFTRWLAVMALYSTLRKVWPAHLRPAIWACALFAVYPGFGQQWISVIYSQAFILLTCFILSLGLMVAAFRRPERFWLFTILALLLSTINLISTEYFYGLELLRPLILWYALNEQTDRRRRFFLSLRHWAPYLILWILYSLWRFLLTQTQDYQGYEVRVFDAFSGGLTAALLAIVQGVIDIFQKAALNAWTQTNLLFSLPLTASSTWLYLLVVAASFAVILFFATRLKVRDETLNDGDAKAGDRWGLEAILLGLLAILLGRLPSWVAGLPVGPEFPYDRFLLSTMLGAALLLAGLIQYFLKSGQRRNLVFSLILALCIGYNFQISNTFRRDWNNLRDTFWQIVWRIPGLEPGTLLLTYELPLKYYSDNSLTAVLNWTYAPDLSTKSMPYFLIYTKIRLGQSLPNLEPDTAVEYDYRAFKFTGNTSQTVTIYQPSGGCLRVLDAKYANYYFLPDLPPWVVETIHLSNPDRVLPNADPPARPPEKVFGVEPEHTWCYYFAKAELARQVGDWGQIVELGDEAVRHTAPAEQSVTLGFIEEPDEVHRRLIVDRRHEIGMAQVVDPRDMLVTDALDAMRAEAVRE